MLLLNVTHTQTGRYNMMSPVGFEHLDDFAGIEDFLNRLRHNDPHKSIAFSNAMRVNASFPYITPVGTITTTDSIGNSITHQYTNTGYYDNIGGTVTQSVATIFEKIIRTSFPELKKKIKLVRLLIAHEKKDYRTTRYSQLLAPLDTLSNLRKGHTRQSMKKLGDEYVIELKQTSIRPAPLAKDRATSKMTDTLLTPVLPLGRYLSTIVIRSMERRLEKVKPQLDAILEVE